MNHDCECCYSVHVCLLHMLALCTWTTCVDTVTCSVMYTLTCVLCVVLLFILIRSCDSYCLILIYSWLTRVSSGTRLMIWQPWLLLSRSRSLVMRLFDNDSWLMSRAAMIIVDQCKCFWHVNLFISLLVLFVIVLAR